MSKTDDDDNDRRPSSPDDNDRVMSIHTAAACASSCRLPTEEEEEQVRAYVMLVCSKKTNRMHVSQCVRREDLPRLIVHLSDLIAMFAEDIEDGGCDPEKDDGEEDS